MTETTRCLGGGLHDRNHKVFRCRVNGRNHKCLGGGLHDRNHKVFRWTA